MDGIITTKGRDTKITIDNTRGSSRFCVLQHAPGLPHERKLDIEYSPNYGTAEIDGIPLTKMQVELLVRFLTQPD